MRVEEELKSYLQVLWRYKWVSIACATIASVVALVVSSQLTPLYSATATLRVASAPGGSADYIYVATLTRLSNTYVEIATSEISLNEVTQRLNLMEQPDVEVEIVSETELIRITASNPDPLIARNIANTLADIMVELSTQLYGGNAPTAREILEDQLQQAKIDMNAAVDDYENALRSNRIYYTPLASGTPMPNPDLETLSHILYVRQQIYADLLQRYEDARTNEQVYANAVTIIEPATPPQKPSTPNLLLNTALGLLAGLAMGVILAFLFEGMDDTVRSIADIQSLTPLPILCAIPELKGHLGSIGSLKLFQRGHLAFAPAFHQLRARLIMTDDAPEAATFLITSPEPGTGKSTIAANLAMSLAEGGNRVVLIDMDLYRPRLHSILDLPNENGLSNFMRGEIQLDAALQSTPYPNLRIITTGSRLDKTSECLTPAIIGSLLKRLKKDGYHVLIDAPAFLSVADPIIIASQADSVVVVSAIRKTERQNLQFTLQQLAELGLKVSGIVVNRISDSHLYRYYSNRSQKKIPFRWSNFTHHRSVPVKNTPPISGKE